VISSPLLGTPPRAGGAEIDGLFRGHALADAVGHWRANLACIPAVGQTLPVRPRAENLLRHTRQKLVAA